MLWEYEAQGPQGELGAGFEVNPLVVDGMIYVGNRDGYFYAIRDNGTLAWRYKTGGPIRFSAAYQDGEVYFASMDGYAYALDTSGNLQWKSAKLPGGGFLSYWPVVFQNYVIFVGSNNYLFADPALFLPAFQFKDQEMADAFPNPPSGPRIGPLGTQAGTWVNGTSTIDLGAALTYFNNKPERRRYFVLNRSNGAETVKAPIFWVGTHSGNRFPPVVGGDNVLYQTNHMIYDPYIPYGIVSGWKFGTQYVSNVTTEGNYGPDDEPFGYSAGGNVLYLAEWYGNQGGAVDVSKPLTSLTNPNPSREWTYYAYDLNQQIPGYSVWNGEYGQQTVNGPVPYNGKVYMNINSAIVAWGHTTANPVRLAPAEIVTTTPTILQATTTDLQQKLKAEIEKMIQAGHLRPGYQNQGLGDLGADDLYHNIPVFFSQYFAYPGDTLVTLLSALPNLTDATLKQQLRTYIQSEFNNYNPCDYSHIGWNTGASRESFDVLPEIAAKMRTYPRVDWEMDQSGAYWRLPPQAFYALWKYAQEFGGASTIFNSTRTSGLQCKNRLSVPPADSVLTANPQILNAYLAGYYGYYQLGVLAGEGSTAPVQNALTTYNRLLHLRLTTFDANAPDWPLDVIGLNYKHVLDTARNFMWLEPEIAQQLATIGNPVTAALDQYGKRKPYWFVSKYDASYGEGVVDTLYNVPALFQAKAWVMQQSRADLVKYLDVPAFAVGDLFYIQNLIAAIEAAP